MNKKVLSSLVLFAALGTQEAQACPTCTEVSSYGSSVVSETGSATAQVASATGDIQQGFTNLIDTLNNVFEDLALAIRAMSTDVTSELYRGSEARKKLMDEYSRQQEVRAQAAYTLESKQYYEERYGEENIPVTSCEDFSDAIDLQVAKEMTASQLREGMRAFYQDYREASPVDDWRYHQRTLEFAQADKTDFNKDVFTSEEVEQAMEWINQAIEPVPVSPIRPNENVAELSADQRELLSEIQTLHLRLDAPKNAMMEQVILKAPIVGQEGSIQSLLADRAYEALSQESLIDIGTGSPTRVLRTLLRDTQYGLVMQYETFKANMNRARVETVALALDVDRYRTGYRLKENLLDGERSVRN